MGFSRLPSRVPHSRAVSPDLCDDVPQPSKPNRQTPALGPRARTSEQFKHLPAPKSNRSRSAARSLTKRSASRLPTDSAASLEAFADPPDGTLNPSEHTSHVPQTARAPLKRKRDANDDVGTRPRSLQRRGEAPAIHTAKRDAQVPATRPSSPRTESSREPTGEQLTDYGRWLAPAELGRLGALREQQCARLWKLVGQARKGKVDPDFCMHVARDNSLAQRNGYGLALMFLDGSVAPEENARRLDGYLLALGAASLPTQSPTLRQVKRELERCVDMAARYLFKTDWFNEAPLEKLAELGNLLSKYPGQPACMKAIAWIAGQVLAPATLPRLGVKELTLLANALSKNVDSDRCEQATARIGRHLLRGREAELGARHVSLLLNAFSKWPDNAGCRTAAESLARRLANTPGLRQAMDAQALATSINALSKWPATEVCQQAAERLAPRLVHEAALLEEMKGPAVAAALNGLSKWPKSDVCGAAAECVAAQLAKHAGLRQEMNAQEVANALNALCKWPDSADCRVAIECLADQLARDDRLPASMNAQEVANALNALGKQPEAAACLAAAKCLAAHIRNDAKLRAALDAQQVSNALNALGKWPDAAACREAAERIDGDAALRGDMSAQHVGNVFNALGKWPDSAICLATVERLAVWLTDGSALAQAMDAQGVAASLNGLSKWPASAACWAAAKRLLAWLLSDAELRQGMDAQGVANVLNAASRWSGEDVCRAVAEQLATRLVDEADLRQAMNSQEVANSLNGLSRWPEQPNCRQAVLLLMARLGGTDLPWRKAEMSALSQAANAISRLFLSAQDEPEVQLPARAKLQDLAAHLDLYRKRFEEADTREIAALFKAMASAQLLHDMRPLARPVLERLTTLNHATGMREDSLETMGNLCLGLLPLARSPVLIAYRRRALSVLGAIQPIVARKVERFVQARQGATEGRAAADMAMGDERHGTRRPALTFYQVIKTYAVVSGMWKTRYVEGSRRAVREQKDALVAWVKQTLARTRDAIESDLGENSWNVIAQIEADGDVLHALDLRIQHQTETITQRHPPSRIDLGAMHRRMRTSAAGCLVAPAPGAGATHYTVVDMVGKEVRHNRDEPNKPYSLFARLTGLPLVEVKLPGEVSEFMLARTFNYQGEPWRFDLFGGSRLSRGGGLRPEDILANHTAPASMLPAVRYADTAPGSDLMQLAAKLAPQREDWSRMQRALLEMVPSDHVVEGTLRLGFFDDVPGPQHPFKLAGPDGRRIQLCPNDGCGFLKYEVAMRIPVFREYAAAWDAVRTGRATPAQQKLVDSGDERKRIAPQALQHFPRDEAALEEARQAIERRLMHLAPKSDRGGPPPRIDPLTLYHLIVSGGYEGAQIRAVPSADDNVHLPAQRSQAFDHHGGALLLGKAPYDKENLLPVPDERVATVIRGDATASFLSRCFAIQYSYTGFNDDAGEGAEMLHSKGMLIVPPPQYWSPGHEGMDMACSREDLKTLSRWVAGRDRAALPPDMLSTGSLRVKEMVVPGRLGALPITELRKRDMDTDGDDAFVYAGYPKLAAHVTKVMALRRQLRGPQRSFKPSKTAAPALDSNSRHYQPGRAPEILSEQRGRRLRGTASLLATRFLAQPDAMREAMARDMMFGVYDGVERSLRNGLLDQIEAERPDSRALVALRDQAFASIARAHLPEAAEAARLLYNEVVRLQSASADKAAELPAALAERFPSLAQAYEQAGDTRARLLAILENYPVCRLSHEQFPDGQPGLVRGSAELTMRNLFTVAIKVGTDSLKADTGTELFINVIEACLRSERAFRERLTSVPYSKETAYAMRDARFDPEQAKAALQRNPNMAAGVMSLSVQALQRWGLLAAPPPPQARFANAPAPDVGQAIRVLAGHARRMEAEITPMLRSIAHATGAQLVGLDHRLKSPGSLKEKLKQLVAHRQLTLEDAVPLVNDALRYGITLPPGDFAAGCRRIQAALDEQGHARVKLVNHFTKQYEPFSAVNLTLRNPEGHLWEIQFHTPRTFELKEQFHDLYKQSHRLRLQGAPAARLQELTRPARDAFRGVPLPLGCDDILDWEAEQAGVALPATKSKPAQKVAPKPAHAALAERLHAAAKAIEPRITPVLRALLQQVQGHLHGDGPELHRHVFKKPASTRRKIDLLQQRFGLSPEQAAARVRDALRYDVVLEHDGFVAGVQSIMRQLQSQGLKVMRVNNAFTVPDTTYAGLNMNLTSGTHHFEIQFHTSGSLRIKQRTHGLYEKLRRIGLSSATPSSNEQNPPASERESLQRQLRSAAANVQRPKGIETIVSVNHYNEPEVAAF
ncbi:XopAD/skwp family type III secretion system effector [Ralstonia solanacearum]|uniref:XopAD/skwp family type III secretion system effector n=1 Tax=Ralstonia solanacearum TaxID=305 RepID=UPI003CC857CC